MPFTIDNSNVFVDKTLIRVSSQGTKMRTLTDEVNNYKWEPAYMNVCQKYYEIEISYDHPEFYVIIKPVKPYYCCNFEEVFEFGDNCKEYTDNRIVALTTNPTNIQKNVKLI